MKTTDYVDGALRTESPPDSFNMGNLALDMGKIRLLHATMGLCTESGELTDQLKKHLFYGKELDRVNLIEEAGDLMWYLAILFDELNTSFEEVMSSNSAKLRSRYPQKFTPKRASCRDLQVERSTLEENIEDGITDE